MHHFKFIIYEVWADDALKNLHSKDFLQCVFKLHKCNNLPCLDINNPNSTIAFNVLLGDRYATEYSGFPHLR